MKDGSNFYVGVSNLDCLSLFAYSKYNSAFIFPKSALPNRQCGLSTDAAYTWLFTVNTCSDDDDEVTRSISNLYEAATPHKVASYSSPEIIVSRILQTKPLLTSHLKCKVTPTFWSMGVFPLTLPRPTKQPHNLSTQKPLEHPILTKRGHAVAS